MIELIKMWGWLTFARMEKDWKCANRKTYGSLSSLLCAQLVCASYVQAAIYWLFLFYQFSGGAIWLEGR